jgi:hypothetical protein
VEAGDGPDPVFSHGKHDETGWVAVQVAREGGLGVGPGRCQAQLALATVGEGGSEEFPDRAGPVVLMRGGRHRQPRVVGKQRDQGVYVGGDEGIRKPAGDFLLGARVPRLRRAA